MVFLYRKLIFIISLLFFVLLTGQGDCDGYTQPVQNKDDTYSSQPWEVAVNQSVTKKEKYPNRRKITPETVRLTLNEYYVPHVSELLNKGVDCIEWLNELDDPYLNRYKLDLKVDPADERFNLLWKEKF